MLFLPTSIWNTPGHYAPMSDATIAVSPDLESPIIAEVVAVYDVKDWPDHIKAPPTGDGLTCIANGNLCTDLWCPAKNDGVWYWQRAGITWLQSDGCAGGSVTAAGFSPIAGLMRKKEWLDEPQTDPFPHTLAMSVAVYAALQGFVWPATAEDSYAASYGGGPAPMGSRWMIDPAADSSVIQDPLIRKVFITLQVYGAIVRDTCGSCPFIFNAEWPSGMERDWQHQSDLQIIRAAMRRVS